MLVCFTMSTTFSDMFLHYLVNQEVILHFQWTPGKTFGSSPHFLAFTVISYLLCTFILSFIKLAQVKIRIVKAVSSIHNLILLVSSLLMAMGCILSLFYHAPHLKWIYCFPPQTSPSGPLFFWGYIFYLSKIYEFLDTLFIILNNAKKRLTFLHVYHHATVVVVCYFWLHTSQSMFPLALITNASVHVIMYAYYLSCALGARPKWKKLVTCCQILQFLGSFVVFGFILYYHFNVNKCSGIYSLCFNALFSASLFVLFIDFYSKSYVDTKKMSSKYM